MFSLPICVIKRFSDELGYENFRFTYSQSFYKAMHAFVQNGGKKSSQIFFKEDALFNIDLG